MKEAMPLSRKDCGRIFERIAADNQTTAAEVRSNIEAAIRAGIADPDAAVQDEWAKVPCKGDAPSPEEVLRYIVRRAKKENVDVLFRRYFKW